MAKEKKAGAAEKWEMNTVAIGLASNPIVSPEVDNHKAEDESESEDGHSGVSLLAGNTQLNVDETQ